MSEKLSYVELHLHSCWSLREGASKPEELLLRAKELGYDTLALTDHDGLYGSMEFAQCARQVGIRPITGAELTLTDGSHLTVLVETAAGYRNLCRLLSLAYNHDREDPRTDRQSLFAHSEGLIVLSGCAEGEIPRLLDSGNARAAEVVAVEYLQHLGAGQFFLELQHHGIYGDSERVAALEQLSRRTGIPIVVTGNVHYHIRERHRLHDVLVAIHHRRTLDTSHELRRANSEFYLKPPDEMATRFAAFPEALETTRRIAERCTFDLSTDLPYELPAISVPNGATMDSYLRGICERAFKEKYGPMAQVTEENRRDARARLERELFLIEKHRLAGFFLVYWKLLKLAGDIAHELHGRPLGLRPDEQPVARGRGSSVASIVCYLIGLSHVDPIKTELYLDRFLNDELHSLPDIDLDFPRDIRDELLRRIPDHFGPEHAALLAAFPTYRFRNAVRDIGKVLGLPEPLLAWLSKLGGSMYAGAEDIEEGLRRIPELHSLAKSPAWRDLVELARELDGFPRHLSQHSGGIVIASEPLSSIVPVVPARMEGRVICQWDKDSIDDARMVKIDLLALGMLSAVHECLDIVEETEGRRPDLGRIDHNKREIYESISAGDTMGLFQIESRAQIQTLPRTQPRNIEDLAVQVAIVRPGPITAGAMRPYMEFRRLARDKRGPDIDYGHPELKPLLEPFLNETAGHVLFQDQVLQVAQAVAGFSPGKADQLRRAMSRKRSGEEMDRIGPDFFAGAATRGVSHAAAAVAWRKMHGFSAFGFPKSHAVAFGLLAYESAWLRYHHPAAYYCALYNNQPMGFYSVEVLNGDAERHGIRILPPDINQSHADAWPEDGNIRLGLYQVKGLGGGWSDKRGKGPDYRSLPERIFDERQANGSYRSLYDLVTRACLKREQAEMLITAGALEAFGLPRRELLWQLGLLFLPEVKRRAAQPAYQPSLPLPVDHDMVTLPGLSPWQEVAWDFDWMGFSPGRHPMSLVRPLLHEGIITSLHPGGVNNPNRLPQGTCVELAGMVVTRQRPVTAKGTIFMLLEDEFELANVIVHKDLAEQQRAFVRAMPFVIVRGRIDNERSGLPNVIADGFRRCPLPGLIAEPASHNFG